MLFLLTLLPALPHNKIINNKGDNYFVKKIIYMLFTDLFKYCSYD